MATSQSAEQWHQSVVSTGNRYVPGFGESGPAIPAGVDPTLHRNAIGVHSPSHDWRKASQEVLDVMILRQSDQLR